jgi:hypothetical protein
VIVQSARVANETLPGPVKDPRVAAVLSSPLVAEARRFATRVRCWCTARATAACGWPPQWTT